MSESLYRHAYFVRPQTMKKLVSFPQVNVNYCLNGETPIMAVGLWSSEDDACCKVYDTLIKAGALNYSNSDELWYDLLSFVNEKSVIIITSKKLANCYYKVITLKITDCKSNDCSF